jgi:hypothetical protein
MSSIDTLCASTNLFSVKIDNMQSKFSTCRRDPAKVSQGRSKGTKESSSSKPSANLIYLGRLKTFVARHGLARSQHTHRMSRFSTATARRLKFDCRIRGYRMELGRTSRCRQVDHYCHSTGRSVEQQRLVGGVATGGNGKR